MMLSALTLIASGGSFVPREVLFSNGHEQQQTNNGPKRVERKMTPRELEVLNLLKQGKPTKSIARELGLSGSTVKVHIRKIMRKVGSTNRTHLAMIANRVVEAEAA